MSRVAKVRVYGFDELSAEAQRAAVERYREYAIYDGWYLMDEEEFTDRLEKEGYKDIEVRFSGFGSQGDGASFTAEVDIRKYLKASGWTRQYPELLRYEDDIEICVERIDNQYSHEGTIQADYVQVGDDATDAAISEAERLVEHIHREARELSRSHYRTLQRSYEDLTSDEHIEEMLMTDDYEFRADGSMFVEQEVAA